MNINTTTSPLPKLTKEQLLEANWQRLQEQIKEFTFSYLGKPAVALKVGSRKKIIGNTFKASLWTPETLLRFLQDGGSPAVWVRKKDPSKEPLLLHTIRLPNEEYPKQIPVGRYVANCPRDRKAKYLGSYLDVRDHRVEVGDPLSGTQNPEYSVRELLLKHKAHRLWPSWDLAQYLVHPGLLDLEGDIFTVNL